MELQDILIMPTWQCHTHRALGCVKGLKRAYQHGVREPLFLTGVRSTLPSPSHLQHYMELLRQAEADKEEAVRAAADAAASVKLQKLQVKLDKVEREKEFLKQVNGSLVQNQKEWQQKFKEQEER